MASKTDKSFEHTTGWCDDSYRCNPHTEVLYYRLADELADKDRVEFGTIYIALEDLR
ncbi:hypothetical protein [Ensifer aridi]|uniref:hypothetical protein n=1 Tax=Ensifer aridi TaxID=1708715 RepID=UPI000AD995B3|nr:hypothetical protein [Ensifer aridi]